MIKLTSGRIDKDFSYHNGYRKGQEDFAEEVKAEIVKNILDEPVENGTNAEMACYNGGLLKCLEIIDKHIGKAESEVTPNE